MDASKLTQMKARASNTYKSNWQGRDASEVTLRNRDKSNKNNSSTHQGPTPSCCTGGIPPVNRSVSPTNGFSTTYEAPPVFLKQAGCADCEDPNFGAPGGVTLLSCAEVQTILTREPNPVKGSNCYCADNGIYRQPFPADCSRIQPSYTGYLNQVGITANQQFGHLPEQQYPYPSG